MLYCQYFFFFEYQIHKKKHKNFSKENILNLARKFSIFTYQDEIINFLDTKFGDEIITDLLLFPLELLEKLIFLPFILTYNQFFMFFCIKKTKKIN